jgi:hypothetical protein
MPALPWTTFSPPDPGREYVVMASRLPLDLPVSWAEARRRIAEAEAGQPR